MVNLNLGIDLAMRKISENEVKLVIKGLQIYQSRCIS